MGITYKNLIIDGPYMAHRALCSPYSTMTTTGFNSTLIHGFLRSLLAMYKKFSPGKIYITWESHGTPSWRRSLLPTYKPSAPNDTYISQLTDLKTILSRLNITQYYSPKNEADDVIASLLADKPVSTLIFTTDKDIHQLISDKKRHHILTNNKLMRENDVFSKFGVCPLQIPDYLALVGDKTDNIKGVRNIGEVKAARLLSKYKTVENIPPTEFPKPTDSITAQFNKKLTLLSSDCLYEPISTPNTSIETLLNKYELLKIKENLKNYKKMGAYETLW